MWDTYLVASFMVNVGTDKYTIHGSFGDMHCQSLRAVQPRIVHDPVKSSKMFFWQVVEVYLLEG